jgi:hypothetical protein
MAPIVNQDENITYVACSKRCHKKVSAALAAGTYPADRNAIRYAWEKDGKLGPEDINNSMNILLHWLTENGGENYIQFRGRNATGMTKANYAEVIARKILAAGVKSSSSAKQVLNKIAHLEATFCTAHDFATTETGAGLVENDQEDTFKKAVEKKCPYYKDLLPLFEDRASAKAHCTSDELDDVDDLASEAEEEVAVQKTCNYYVADDATIGETGAATTCMTDLQETEDIDFGPGSYDDDDSVL